MALNDFGGTTSIAYVLALSFSIHLCHWIMSKFGDVHAIDISYILDDKDASLLIDLNLIGNKI